MNAEEKNNLNCHAERSEVALYAITYSVTSGFLDSSSLLPTTGKSFLRMTMNVFLKYLLTLR
jgi:hypothetical protein